MKLCASLFALALVAGCATPPAASPAPGGRSGAERGPGSISLLATASDLAVADALTQGKPLVVLFATPGFCTSQTCGPQLEVFQTVANRYRDRANFIHVEIFKDPQARTPNATVEEWSLPSEPWTFVVDAAGNLADKFDGMP